MKRILASLILPLCVTSQVCAQQADDAGRWDFSMFTDSAAISGNLPATLEGWKDNLEHFGRTVPQEEIFVHMDNTCYFAGDTLYFKAYVRRSDTGRPTNLSRLLYAELWNQDGYLVERHLVRLTEGQGYGSFCLDDSLYGGFYELRAYTRWQLNWGEYQHKHTWQAETWFFSRKMAKEYYRDYEKLYSRIFPLYDKPKTPGDYVHQMTTRPMQRYFRTELRRPDPEAKLYPEGGVLVAGTHARIAFEANEQDGEHISGTMRITGRGGRLVAEARTENRGRGLIEMDYDPEESYKARFESDSGRVISVKMPLAEEDGCAVRTDVEGDRLHLHLQPRGAAAGETLGVTVMTGGALRFFQKFYARDTDFVIPTDSLPTGVAQVTVYNGQGRVYSDRLVFIRHADVESSALRFSGMRHMYRPYDSIHVKVSNPHAAGTSISLAVRDAAYSQYLYDSSNMLTEMLLCSQIRGFVEQPDYYFERDDAEHRRHLDLLLLVQGWRRHNWITMATPGIFRIHHPIEDTPVFFGTVNRYFHPGREGVDGWGTEYGFLRDRESFEYTPRLWNGPDSYFRHRGSPNSESVPTLGTASYAREMHSTYSYFLRDHKKEDSQGVYYAPGRVGREVKVHVDITKPTADGLSTMEGDIETREGRFILQMPVFYDRCILNLSASDTTKWKNDRGRRGLFWWLKFRKMRKSGLKLSKEHQWVLPDEMEYPEFYVRLTPYYPRFVKPFNFYHTHVAPFREGTALAPSMKDTRTLGEVKVRARHGGLRKFSAEHPARVMDAYEAFNESADAGFTPGWFIGPSALQSWVARLLVGDMNEYRPYQSGKGYGYMPTFSGFAGGGAFYTPESIHAGTMPYFSGPDSPSMVHHVPLLSQGSSFSDGFGGFGSYPGYGTTYWDPTLSGRWYSPYSQRMRGYSYLKNLSKVHLITDYCPRQEGSKRYKGANQPTVNVIITQMTGGVRPTYRDRHYVMQGFSVCEEFYQPVYRHHVPAVKDYRRTLYWNPNLPLDDKGEAHIQCWNNGRQTAITVSAEGLSAEGQIVTGISYPEDR